MHTKGRPFYPQAASVMLSAEANEEKRDDKDVTDNRRRQEVFSERILEMY